MKYIYFLFIASLITISGLQAEEYGMPSKVKILSNDLTLKELKGSKKGFIAEYVPEGETFENWTNMFAVRFVEGKKYDPESTAKQTHSNIQTRKAKGDLYANSMVLISPDKKHVVVDFLISDKQMLEHNIWRYFKRDGGLVSYQIARRVYSLENSQDFIKNIQTGRESFLKEITKESLPVPKFK